MKKKRKACFRRFTTALSVIGFAVMLFLVLDYYGSSDSNPQYPKYKSIPLEEITGAEELYNKEADEHTGRLLFLQTGLGEEGLETVRKECKSEAEFFDVLKDFQRQLFEGKGDKTIVDLETGDILVSMSQRFCFYPHGHAAIVTDGKKNEILEARSYQAGSCSCKLSKWSNLSSFVVLRLKEEVVREFIKDGAKNPAQSASTFAKNNLDGLKYSLLKDMRPLKGTSPKYTQCAHLVWYAYFSAGLDIDENRGLIVKPVDFLKSDMLEVVQVFGIRPDKLLKMRNE